MKSGKILMGVLASLQNNDAKHLNIHPNDSRKMSHMISRGSTGFRVTDSLVSFGITSTIPVPKK